MTRLSVLLLATTLAARADLLTFPSNVCSNVADGGGAQLNCGNSSFLNQSYGDTAQVNVTYRDMSASNTTLRYWGPGYNNLPGVAWATGGDQSSLARVELLPLGGLTLTLNSFAIGAYPAAIRGTNVRVLDLATNTILIDYGAQTVGTGNVAAVFSPALASTSGLAIEWQNSAFNVGIGNIDFTLAGASTATPEPSTALLLIGGIAILLGTRGTLLARAKRENLSSVPTRY